MLCAGLVRVMCRHTGLVKVVCYYAGLVRVMCHHAGLGPMIMGKELAVGTCLREVGAV